MDNPLVPTENLNYHPHYLQLLSVLGHTRDSWELLLRCPDKVAYLVGCFKQYEDRCKTLEGQCELIMKLFRHVCCPANVNFSKLTIDGLSDESQVNLNTIVQNFGPDFVNTFPVPPGKKIRLTHPTRPGWTPVEIRIDLSLGGGAQNYLDFTAQFDLGPGEVLGQAVGPLYFGNQFLNKDGTQIRVPFPKYKGEWIDVGSLERLGVIISNKSAGVNLDSAQVVVLFDNNRFYEMCKGEICKPGCPPCG